MSHLSRTLHRVCDELHGKKSYIKNIIAAIDDWWHNCVIMDFWYRLQWVWTNRWLFKHIWTFRTYSAEYSIELFCDSLVAQAEGNRCGWSINAEKDYRRCLYAAERIRKAYTEDLEGTDKSALHQAKNNPIEMIELDSDLGNRFTMSTKWHISEEYGRKIEKLIDKRVASLQEQRRKAAWDYFIKYYDKFGD